MRHVCNCQAAANGGDAAPQTIAQRARRQQILCDQIGSMGANKCVKDMQTQGCTSSVHADGVCSGRCNSLPQCFVVVELAMPPLPLFAQRPGTPPADAGSWLICKQTLEERPAETAPSAPPHTAACTPAKIIRSRCLVQDSGTRLPATNRLGAQSLHQNDVSGSPDAEKSQKSSAKYLQAPAKGCISCQPAPLPATSVAARRQDIIRGKSQVPRTSGAQTMADTRKLGHRASGAAPAGGCISCRRLPFDTLICCRQTKQDPVR